MTNVNFYKNTFSKIEHDPKSTWNLINEQTGPKKSKTKIVTK